MYFELHVQEEIGGKLTNKNFRKYLWKSCSNSGPFERKASVGVPDGFIAFVFVLLVYLWSQKLGTYLRVQCSSFVYAHAYYLFVAFSIVKKRFKSWHFGFAFLL